MRNRRQPSTFVIFPSGLALKYNSDYETKQRGLTMSWGVSLPSSHSRRWWSSQIPQMCRSLLSPQKSPDDLEKQRSVNNSACFKGRRWNHCRSQMCILKRWKRKLQLLWYGSTELYLCCWRYGGTVSKMDAHARTHPCQAELIRSSLEGAGDRSGSERGRRPGARWQM